MASSDTLAPDLDDLLCSRPRREQDGESNSSSTEAAPDDNGCASPARCLSGASRIQRAWDHWTKLGRPKRIVAPMVDNSELPFRMLCRKYGAEAAYTPMLHSRIFTENDKYRNEEFTTCKVTNVSSISLELCALSTIDFLLEFGSLVI